MSPIAYSIFMKFRGVMPLAVHRQWRIGKLSVCINLGVWLSGVEPSAGSMDRAPSGLVRRSKPRESCTLLNTTFSFACNSVHEHSTCAGKIVGLLHLRMLVGTGNASPRRPSISTLGAGRYCRFCIAFAAMHLVSSFFTFLSVP